MSKLELQLNNGRMNLNIIALIGDNALLKRLNDNSFIVVRGLKIHNDFTCEWDYALGYFNNYDYAFSLFNRKIVKEFSAYEDVVIEKIINDDNINSYDNTTESDVIAQF